ncbi:alpha/beta hydrolase family protein [Allorhizocola rhizosphaerae]|uniref:alpha/beta hydrolase family protein n=1 Tax=Allorhizocola rhizosphaerae TaxID=1872709 RepID=UPI0013C2CE34|nr:alpha/beta hydrolase [Allorhizocola rhizosphaerae]
MRSKIVIAAAGVALLLAGGVGVVLHQHSYDMREERVTIGALDGVLAKPDRVDGPVGLVVFVHGDGPVNATHDGFYRPIWEAFARAGYASLSWNKPGVAGSAGNWLHQSMEDRADEVTGAVEWARSRADIDGHRIGLWGASQAGWVMPKVAVRVPDLAFVIAVSPAVNWLEQGRYHLLARLHAEGASPAEITAATERSDMMRRLLRAGATYGEYRRQPGADANITADRWTFLTKNHLADATADLTASRVPVLLLLGGRDINVDVADTEAVYRKTTPILEVRRYPDATHSMIPHAVEDSTVRMTTTALFTPRSLFTDGFLADQRQYLETRPA